MRATPVRSTCSKSGSPRHPPPTRSSTLSDGKTRRRVHFDGPGDEVDRDRDLLPDRIAPLLRRPAGRSRQPTIIPGGLHSPGPTQYRCSYVTNNETANRWSVNAPIRTASVNFATCAKEGFMPFGCPRGRRTHGSNTSGYAGSPPSA
jgi:hypothetical protein